MASIKYSFIYFIEQGTGKIKTDFSLILSLTCPITVCQQAFVVFLAELVNGNAVILYSSSTHYQVNSKIEFTKQVSPNSTLTELSKAKQEKA